MWSFIVLGQVTDSVLRLGERLFGAGAGGGGGGMCIDCRVCYHRFLNDQSNER